MAKKYETEGRTLYNYRGRFGRLTVVPTKKARNGLAACDTLGTAYRVLEAAFRDSVLEIGTEPQVDHEALPTGRMHLDVRERLASGRDHYTEVKAERFVSAESVERLEMVAQRLAEQGSTLEFSLRDDVVKRVQAKGLQFLYRFRGECQPDNETRQRVLVACCTPEVHRLSVWLANFRSAGLQPRDLYWALARDHLRVVDERGLFPDGEVAGVPR